MFETLQTRQPLICFHVYGIMAYRVQHTRWSVQRNSMAVQMLNLGILESLSLGIFGLWNCYQGPGIFGSWNHYWNPYWDIGVLGLWIPRWSLCCIRHKHPC